MYNNIQRFDMAEQMYKSSLVICKRLVDTNSQIYEPDLANIYNNLALLYCDIHRFKESEQMHMSALEIRKRLAAANPQAYEPNLAESYNNLANLYFSTNRYYESEQMYKTALEIRKRLAAANPQAYEQGLTESYNNLANLYNITQHFKESELVYKMVLEKYKRLAESNPHIYVQKQAECEFWIADVQLKLENYSEAIISLENALIFYKKEVERGAFINYYSEILYRLSQLYGLVKKYSIGYSFNKQNIPSLRTLYQSDKSNYIELLNGILVSQSFYSIFEKQYVEAENYSKEALKVDSTKHVVYGNLAAALLFQGKYQEAEKIYRQYKSELKEDFLSDFEEFSKAGVIPKNREEDVEKIKQLLLKE